VISPETPAARRSSLFADRAVSVIVITTLFLFTLIVALVVYLVIRVSDVADGNRADAVNACELANGNRSEDVRIINEILNLPAISKPQFITPVMRAAQDAALARVHANVKTAYALRDCAAEYGG
jgi:hypothetical protein